MWQLFDIAYVIPASVFLGYALGKFLEGKYPGTDWLTYSIVLFALIGFVLTIVKIKRFVDRENAKTKSNKDQ